MARTQINGTQVEDGSIKRTDLDVSTAGEAVIRKVIAGSNISITYTGVDAGTGDVTINSIGGGVGGSAAIEEVSLDFGSTPVEGKKFVFTLAGATVGQQVMMQPNSLLEGDELEMDGLLCAAHVSATDEITAYIKPAPGPVSGVRHFNVLLG